MEKNIILAIVLSVTVLIVYNIFFMPQPSEKKEVSQPPQKKEQAVEEEVGKETVEEPAPAEAKPAKGRPITLENTNMKVTVNTEGGRITSWYLKEKETDLLGGETEAIKFYLRFPENEIFDFSGTNFKIKKKEDKNLVLFWENEEKNIEVTETVKLPKQGYHAFFDLSMDYPANGECYLVCPTKIGKKAGDKERLAFWEDQLYKEKEQGVKSEYTGRIKWLGVRDDDFITAIVPLNRVEKGNFKIDTWSFSSVKRDNRWVIYAGPQSYTYVRLANNFVKEKLGEDYHLTDALDIGIWGYLSVGISKILIFFYGFTHNYGIAIILLTLLIYSALSPLTIKQFESMQKMQAVQPELKKMQKKFKGEPKKMQAEMMKIYSQHKINPMAGCLPMVIQLPIIFILYRALLGFPFAENPSFLWINNLGEPDIPLLLGLAGCMFLQQRISQRMQTVGEQAGIAKMMQFFPLFLILILWSLPSGVMLYWFTSTLISIVQQFFIRKRAASAQGQA